MKKTKRMLQKLLFAVLCCSLLMGLVACGGNSLRIDAPETVNAESGLYTSPEYQVVDADGKPVEGMTVRLKSVSDPDGKNEGCGSSFERNQKSGSSHDPY